MICKQCGKELELVTGKRVKQYCDNKCKMQYLRKNKGDKVLADNQDLKTPSVESATINSNRNGHIVTPPQIVTENNHIVTISQRNAETRDRLARTTLSELKANNIYIPCWRYLQGEYAQVKCGIDFKRLGKIMQGEAA